MSRNIKFRFLLAPIVVALLVVTSPVAWAGELEDAQEAVRQNPNDADTHHTLGDIYYNLDRYQEAIASYKEVVRIDPNNAKAHHRLGVAYISVGQKEDAVTFYKEATRI
ncbi:MAG: tetratricopeptide repeat protein, partial [Nitrospinota bacterium]|nr:tetratricopeptide repeat protein [Nitrospinota bacterium]